MIQRYAYTMPGSTQPENQGSATSPLHIECIERIEAWPTVDSAGDRLSRGHGHGHGHGHGVPILAACDSAAPGYPSHFMSCHHDRGSVLSDWQSDLNFQDIPSSHFGNNSGNCLGTGSHDFRRRFALQKLSFLFCERKLFVLNLGTVRPSHRLVLSALES